MQARIGENMNVLASVFHAHLDPLLAAELTADDRERLAAEGAALRDDAVFKLTFGDSP